jgi:leucyl aminopeptidase
MKIEFSSLKPSKSPVLVLFAADGQVLAPSAMAVDRALDGKITTAIKATDFKGSRDAVLDLVAPGGAYKRVFLIGIGKPDQITARDVEMLGGHVAGVVGGKSADVAVFADLPGLKGIDAAQAAARLASGASLRTYSFTGYKTAKKDNAKELKGIIVHCADASKARAAFLQYDALCQGNHMARDLVNEPANVLVPIEFAKRAQALSRAGVKVETLNAAQMKKLGMGALLGVAQGSVNAPRLVVMRWNGGKRGEAPVAFIGKGVTFDTGGVSIKPAAGMEDMKGDMAGAACVTGLMLALAKRKAKVNAIGAIGLVENAIDGNAQRPGDVVKSMSGQTIAVLNTDAEGRLVLADVLWYIQDRYKPKFMVNLATLTGAILIALGKEHAGLFSNNDELAERLAKAGLETGEKVWRMPLTPEYDKLLEHDVADMKNIGGRNAGSITAAQFLQRFVNNVPWAHLDIAGTAMDSVKSPINQSWASGWGVRLLNRLVAEHYEGR